MKIFKVLLVLLPALLLGACGGGSSSSLAPDSSRTGALSVFVTDDVSIDYPKVWVTVTKLTAHLASVGEVVLYEDAAGTVFNLAELNGVAALLNTQDLAPGTYNNFAITLANDLTLVDKTGQSITAHFNTTGDPETLHIAGAVIVPENGSASIAFDFDLKQFVYDPTTNLVSPVVLLVHQDKFKFDRLYADLKGTVNAVLDDTSFELTLRDGVTVVTVNLGPGATVADELTQTVVTDTSTLGAGQKVKVYGDYDASTQTMTAVRVKIQNSLSAIAPDKVEGFVQSWDGSTLVLDVREANFQPGSTTLDIADVSNAVFTKGSLADLAEGQWVEIHGTWADPVFTAQFVEIEGGLPHGSGDHHQYADDYAEVKGSVQAVNGDIVTVSITKSEHFTPTAATIDIDVSNAWFKYGDASCLLEGAFIEAKGAVDTATGMTAWVVEIQSACGSNSSSSSDIQGNRRAEVKGTM